jgi:hypothetical protein
MKVGSNINASFRKKTLARAQEFLGGKKRLKLIFIAFFSF